MRTLITSIVLVAAATASAAARPATREHAKKPQAKAQKAALVVTSSAFKNTEAIPQDYTCEAAGKAPPLSWSKAPLATKSFAILVEDPDATSGTFTHWLVTDIPASTTSIEPGTKLPAEAMTGQNGKGDQAYAPPCPPSGKHRYIFHVYALDANLGKPMNRADFLAAIRGHVLAQGELIGTYQKAPR